MMISCEISTMLVCSTWSQIFYNSYPLFPRHYIHFSQTHPPLLMPVSKGLPYFSVQIWSHMRRSSNIALSRPWPHITSWQTWYILCIVAASYCLTISILPMNYYLTQALSFMSDSLPLPGALLHESATTWRLSLQCGGHVFIDQALSVLMCVL